MLDAIAEGRTPTNSGASALAVQHLIEALLRGAGRGRFVTL
jgi:hypothetical protein